MVISIFSPIQKGLYLFKKFITEIPSSLAKFTGTAFPICLYWFNKDPQKCQLSGNVCILAYSLIVNGLVSSGWQRSVCFCAGEQVNVKHGSSQDIRLAIPVFPPLDIHNYRINLKLN